MTDARSQKARRVAPSASPAPLRSTRAAHRLRRAAPGVRGGTLRLRGGVLVPAADARAVPPCWCAAPHQHAVHVRRPSLQTQPRVPAHRPAADYRPAGRGPRHAGGACGSRKQPLRVSTRRDARTRSGRRRAPRRGSACPRRAARSSRGPSPDCRGSRATQRWMWTTRRSSRTGCALSDHAACADLWVPRVLTRRACAAVAAAARVLPGCADGGRGARATRLRACARRVR